MPPSPFPLALFPRSTHADNSLSIIGYVTPGLCIGLVTICVTLRFYAKHHVWRSFDREDFTCAIAYLLVVGHSVGSIIYVAFGGGLHTWELDASQLRHIRQVLYALQLIYILCVVSIKILLLSVLVRIFSPREHITYFIRVFIVSILAYYIASFLVRIFICTPIALFWDPTLNGTCVDYHALYLVDSFVSLITDGAILVLPVILAWPLQLPLSKKIRIAVILGAGGIATLSNIYRLYLTFTKGTSADVTGYIVRLLYTGAAEVGLGFMCACLPAINALIMHVKRVRAFSSSAESGPTGDI